MLLIDVNVLVYAHRRDATNHKEYLRWLERVVNGPQAFGMAELVLSGFIRVVTHPGLFTLPSSMKSALAFANEIRERPNCVQIVPALR